MGVVLSEVCTMRHLHSYQLPPKASQMQGIVIAPDGIDHALCHGH